MPSSTQVASATKTKAPKANDGTLKLRGDGGAQTTKSNAGSTKASSQSPDKKKAVREKAIAKLRDELGLEDLAPSIADLTSKLTDADHLNYAKSELRELWKSVFGDKDIPDTIATNAEFKDTQITDDFRSQVDMIKSIATAHTEMIQKYEKYTGGYVSRLVKDKLRAIPNLAAASTSSALTVKSSTPQSSVKSTDVTIPNSPQTDTAVSVSKADKRKMAEAALARQAKSKQKDTASTSSAVSKPSKRAKTDTSSSAVGTKPREQSSALSTTDKGKAAKALAKKQASKTSKSGPSAATQATSTASGKSTKTAKTKEERKAEGLANLKKWKAESEAAKSQSSAASTTIPNGTSPDTSALKKTGTTTTAGRTELPADVMEKIRKMNADLKPVMEARSDYAELTAASEGVDWTEAFKGMNQKWEATLAAKLDKMEMTQNADGTVSRTITESVSPDIFTTMTDLKTGPYTERVYQVRNAADTKPAFSINGGCTATGTGQTSQASSLKFPFQLNRLKRPSTVATVPTSSAPASVQPTTATTSAEPTSLAASTLGAASNAASSIAQTVKDAASSAVSTAKDTVGLGSESASTSLTEDQKRQAIGSLKRRSSKSSKGGSGRPASSSSSRTRATSGVSKARRPGSSGGSTRRSSKAPSSSRATSAR